MSASIHRSSTGSRDAKEEGAFPVQTVTILVLCLTLNNYTLVSLFPYIGVMVMHLLGLETTNEAGETYRYHSIVQDIYLLGNVLIVIRTKF